MWTELPTELRRGIIDMGKEMYMCEFIEHKKSFIYCLLELTINLWKIDAKTHLSSKIKYSYVKKLPPNIK